MFVASTDVAEMHLEQSPFYSSTNVFWVFIGKDHDIDELILPSPLGGK